MKKELTGLERQDAFLTKFYSQQTKCPSCGGSHSYVEARGSCNWRVDATAYCPNTGAILVVEVPMIGGEYFFRLRVTGEQSIEEEQEWMALDDNMDWMSDDQIKQTADLIRKKYHKS